MALKGPNGDKSGRNNVTAFFVFFLFFFGRLAGSSVKIQTVWAMAKTFFKPRKVYQSTLKRQNVSRGDGEEPCT